MTATTAYATRAQLLGRCNLQRLAQLAVPTGGYMPDVVQVRAALLGDTQSLATVDTDTANVLAEAVAAVDTVLVDGADLMRGYAVPLAATWTTASPAQPVPPVLVRLNCQLAMHYLTERAGLLAESDSANYNALLKLLARHASGEVALVTTTTPDAGTGTGTGTNTSTNADEAFVSSRPGRYSSSAEDDAGVGL